LETNQFRDLIRQRREALVLVWIGLTASIGVYAFVGSVITEDDLPREVSGIVTALFWLVALGLAGASIQLPRKFWSVRSLKKLMRKPPDLRELARRPRSTDVDGDVLEQLEALPPEEQRLMGVVPYAFKPMLLGLALSEGVALTGLVSMLVHANFFSGFPMLMIAFALNGWHFPRLDKGIDLARKQIPDEELADFNKELRSVERKLDPDAHPRPRPRKPSRPQPPK
jgi:hypothetical protein